MYVEEETTVAVLLEKRPERRAELGSVSVHAVHGLTYEFPRELHKAVEASRETEGLVHDRVRD